MRRSAWWRGPRVLVPAAVLLATVFACTTFDGISVPPPGTDGGNPSDTGTPDVSRDSPGSDAGGDACGAATKGYLSLAEAAKACSFVMDCDTGQFELDIETNLGIITSSTSYAYCMNALAGTVPSDRPGLAIQQQVLQCVARAPNCGAARACLAVESIVGQDSRCVDGGPQNEAGVYCANGGADIVDCTSSIVQHCATPMFANGSCVLDPGDPGYYGCGRLVTQCASQIASCEIATSVLDDCAQGTSVDTTSDCKVFGTSCGTPQVDGGPTAACMTDGLYRPCDTTTFRDQCDSDSSAIATCTFIGILSRTNCAAMGKRCDSTNGTPLCVGTNDPCTPFSLGIGQCQGNQVTLCIDGQPTSFDCSCSGLACGALNGAGSAHCIPR